MKKASKKLKELKAKRSRYNAGGYGYASRASTSGSKKAEGQQSQPAVSVSKPTPPVRPEGSRPGPVPKLEDFTSDRRRNNREEKYNAAVAEHAEKKLIWDKYDAEYYDDISINNWISQ